MQSHTFALVICRGRVASAGTSIFRPLIRTGLARQFAVPDLQYNRTGLSTVNFGDKWSRNLPGIGIPLELFPRILMCFN